MNEYQEFLDKQLKNSEVKAEYDALESEFATIQAELDAQKTN